MLARHTGENLLITVPVGRHKRFPGDVNSRQWVSERLRFDDFKEFVRPV